MMIIILVIMAIMAIDDDMVALLMTYDLGMTIDRTGGSIVMKDE